MKRNKMNTGKYLVASTSVLIAVLLILVAFTATNVFSTDSDWFNMTVTISNTAPYVLNSTMAFNDMVTGADLQMAVSSNTNIVSCNATASDVNGWQDIESASAVFWHYSTTSAASNDKNLHYSAVNGTVGLGNCNLGVGSGNDVPVVCQIYLEHEATNGSWYCNITVTDSQASTGFNVTDATVSQLVAMTVLNETLGYGAMSPDTDSSTLAANVSNEGNVEVQVQVNGTAMVCDVVGDVPLTNIKYSATNQAYSAMGATLTDTATTMSGFLLKPEGVSPFTEDQNATLNTYWAIHVPVGVKGTCVGNVTVTAIAVV